MASEPPVPVSAQQTGPGAARVVFDRPLAAGALDASNWTDDSMPVPVEATSATASGSQVDLAFGLSPSVGVRFDPPPFDLQGAEGRTVQAFVIPFS